MRVVLLLAIATTLACADGAETAAPDTGGLTVEDTGPALVDDAYRFCHEAGFDAEHASTWCDIMDDALAARCPGLAATCEGAAPVAAPRGCMGAGGGSGARGVAAAPERPEVPDVPMTCDWEAPELGDLTAVLQWFAAILVALAIAAGVGFLLRALGLGRDRRPRAVVAPADAELVLATADQELPEGAPEDLLACARAAIERGEHAEGLRLARGTALRALGRAGSVRLHRARTDREYVRSLRRQPELQRDLRRVVAPVEGWRFGGHGVGRDAAVAAVEAAASILERLGPAAVALGAVLLLAAAPALAQDVVFDRYGPLGDAALRHEVEALGWRLVDIAEVGDVADDVDVLLLDATAVEVDESAWDALDTWVWGGGRLVLFGEGAPVLDLGPLSGVDLVAPAPGEVPRLPAGRLAVWDAPRGYVETELASGVLVQWVARGDGAILAVADARVSLNGALAHPDNARWLRETLRTAGYRGARVALATWPSQGTSNPVSAVANARLLPFVAQIALFMAVAALARGASFGRRRAPPSEGRQAFSEHVRALGRRWRQARAPGRAAVEMSRLWLGRLGPFGLEAAARRSGMSAADATALAGRVVEVAERGSDDRSDPEDDLELVEALWTITRRR